MLVEAQLERSFRQLNPGVDDKGIARMVNAAKQCWESRLPDALERERNNFYTERGYLPLGWDEEMLKERAYRAASEYMCEEFMVAALEAPALTPVEADAAALEAQHRDALKVADAWKLMPWSIRVTPEMESTARLLFSGASETVIAYAGALFEQDRAYGRDIPSGERHPAYWPTVEKLQAAEAEWVEHYSFTDGDAPATGSMRDVDLGGRYDKLDVSAAVLEWDPEATASQVEAYVRHLHSEFFRFVRFMEDRLIENATEYEPLGPSNESYGRIKDSSIESAIEHVDTNHFTRDGFDRFVREQKSRQRHLRLMCSPDGWKQIYHVEVSDEALDRARSLFPGCTQTEEWFAACWLEHRLFRGLPLPENRQGPLGMDMTSEVFGAFRKWLEMQNQW